jgi:hypothetical protein
MQIVTGDVGVDSPHQLADVAERPAPNGLLGDEAEPALHLIEPTGVGGSVVDVIARSARQPGLNLGMLVGAVVVRDQMDSEPRRDAAVEVIKKCEEFLMAMARFTQRNHFAVEGVEGCEQSGRTVAVIARSLTIRICCVWRNTTQAAVGV